MVLAPRLRPVFGGEVIVVARTRDRRRWLVQRRCLLCGQKHRLIRDKIHVCRACALRPFEGL